MPQQNKFILKSFSWVAFSNLITKPFNVLLFIYAARILGTFQYGIYVFALSIGAIISIFFDFGLDYIAVREVAKDNQKLNYYFTDIIFIRFILFIIILTGIVLYFLQNDELNSTQTLAIIILLFFQFTTILLKYIKSLSSAYQDFDVYSKMMIFEKALVTVTGFIVLFVSSDVIHFLLVILAANIVSLCIFVFVLNRLYTIKFIPFEMVRIKKILKEALPLLTVNIFIMAYFRIDVIIMNYLVGDKAIVGVYGSIHRVIEMYMLLPAILMSTSYPMINKYLEEDDGFITKLVSKVFQLLVLVSLPIAILISLNGYKINLLLYGKSYEAGGSGLSFIIWTIIPLGFNYVLGHILISLRKQNYCALGVGIGALFNIISNWLLIPRYGIVGASISALLTELLIFLIYGFFTIKYFSEIGLFNLSLKVLIISLFVLSIFYLYTSVFGYNFYISSFIFTGFTLILIFLTKILKLEDIRKILSLVF